ncbi:MAG: histone deacetylase family protein [Ascidiaceihabitans sp.]|nr:histone deacetylase family protein [Ascidiaceihabitans sp.]
MKTSLITHPDCLGHVTPDGAPEQVARLRYILDALQDLDVLRTDAPLADDADILRCHPQSHIDRIRASIPSYGFASLDADTSVSAGSLAAAYRAAGGAVAAVDLVLSDHAQNAFVAVRPPGHHAEATTPMGFCLFGNVAIAAKHALEHLDIDRVAVVDFDVHHGNGTQALLSDEPRALVITSQQMPLWPGSGEASDRGPLNNIVNIPLAPGSDGVHALKTYDDIAFPALRVHQPDLILISAGFDAHQDDPLANLSWSTDDFAKMTAVIAKLAQELCKGRLVSVLEGGYDLDALATSARVHVQELMKAAR